MTVIATILENPTEMSCLLWAEYHEESGFTGFEAALRMYLLVMLLIFTGIVFIGITYVHLSSVYIVTNVQLMMMVII